MFKKKIEKVAVHKCEKCGHETDVVVSLEEKEKEQK